MVASSMLLAFLAPSPVQMLIIAVIGILLFGKRLPEVGRSVGKSIVEFKKGLQGIESEVESASRSSSRKSSYDDDYAAREERIEATAPKFEPPASEPVEEESAKSANV